METDTTFWRRVHVLTHGINDRALFEAAVDLIGDTHAANPARLVAMHVVVHNATGKILPLAEWSRTKPYGANANCTTPWLTDSPHSSGIAELLPRALAAVKKIVNGKMVESLPVHVVAECAEQHLSRRLKED